MKLHQIKNTLKIKPIQINTYNEHSISISDSFVFRTDKKFETVFRFIDILDLYFDLSTDEIILEFYCKNNKLIKKKIFNQIKNQNELFIDQNFLDGYSGIGTFVIYHIPKNKEKLLRFNNRCYVGYKKNNSYSFVHGNTYVKGLEILSKKEKTGFVKQSLLSNWKYILQKDFSKYDFSELLIVNPLDTNLKLNCNNENYILKKNCIINIEIKNISTVKLTSNCTLLRPVVFSYKDNFFDVHHG